MIARAAAILMVLAGMGGAAAGAAAQDSLPVVTLAEAIERSARLDPDYVQALGQVDNAVWGRRVARLAFVLPSVTLSTDLSKYSSAFFNIGTGEPQSS